MERRNYLVPDAPRWPVDPERPVIQLQGVTKRFGGRAVLEGLSLDVPTGETTVICGTSGSGKSVLLKLMNGLLLPDEGRVLLFGEDTRRVSGPRLLELRKRVTMMFQNYALLDSLTVAENIAFPLYENTRMPWVEIEPLVRELLVMLNLPDAGDRLPAALSGGMKKRVSLARALISNPEVVLFDEPTTGLDPIMIDFVDDMLIASKERFGITSVIISHDMGSATRLADTVAMLEEGRVTVRGTPLEVRTSGDALAAVFFEGAGEELSTAGSGATQESAGGPHGEPGEAAVEPAVELLDVRKSFGSNAVLKGLTMTIPKGKITVLIGPSGSGKSVSMKHIIGIFRPDAGAVRVFGEDISRLSDAELLHVRTRFGMLFQGAALLDALTVAQNVAFPLRERGLRGEALRARVDDMLRQLGLAGLAGRFPSEISNGQRKRVGLARAIITKPEIMIYDEPTTGQDPVMTRQVDDMIVEAQEMFQITSIVVSHDMVSAFRIGHRIALLFDGEIRAFGSPDVVRASRDPLVRRFIYAGTPEGDAAARALGEAPSVGAGVGAG